MHVFVYAYRLCNEVKKLFAESHINFQCHRCSVK